MARPSTRIEGLRELEAALADLPKTTGKNVLGRVLKKAAAATVADAQSNAPRDTGGLSASIIVGAKLNGRQTSLNRQQLKNRSGVEMFIGPSYEKGKGGRHGHLLEFGTVNMPAQPFMRPAWDANKDAALRTIADDLGSEIEKAAARLARKAARKAAKG
ncbi:MAG: HK97-gp10 family putative phage morphogenesis protein [Erythrobacter sp.]|nr:HK97 gp10 family phage protein [Erythrobacter sp.]MDZ4274238.1 HK97-gp10 family putative phage morphogenesis protein [Erythrobacter sp.]